MIVYRLYDAQTDELIGEHTNNDSAQQHRCILEEAVQKPIYICEHQLPVWSAHHTENT